MQNHVAVQLTSRWSMSLDMVVNDVEDGCKEVVFLYYNKYHKVETTVT